MNNSIHNLTTFTAPDGELYIRVIPSKSLFKSTMVHEVVNRGDVFAIRVKDSTLTIISGKLTVEHSKHSLDAVGKIIEDTHEKIKDTPRTVFVSGNYKSQALAVHNTKSIAELREELKNLRDQIVASKFKHGENLTLW